MGLLDQLVASKIKKASDAEEKAQKQLEASKINKGILDLASQTGNPADLEGASTVVEAIGNTDPDVSKIIFQSIEKRIKDQSDFRQTLLLEKYKAGTAAVTEVVKSMAEKGGYTPEQLQQIQAESADRVYQSLGIGDIAQRINQATQAPAAPATSQPDQNQTGSDFFTKPIPPKKTDKQLDQEKMLGQGNRIIKSLREKFNEIDDKYGVGRIQGQITGARGALGDILPKGKQAPEVAVYEGLLDGAAVFVGRNVWNDDRVSQDDRGTYKKALAKLANTREEANLMFDALEEFSQTEDPQIQTALKLMVPHLGSGKSIAPSEALSQTGLLKVAINKKTGEKMYQDRKTGKWRPLPNQKKK